MVVPPNPTFPGRGGTPLEPQAFYVELPVGQTPDFTKLFRGIWRTLPEVYWTPPRDPTLYTWTWGINALQLAFTGRNLLTAGVVHDELPAAYNVPYRIDQTWLFSSTALQLTPRTFVLRPLWRSLPDQPAPPLLQRSEFIVPLPLRAFVQAPFHQTDWPLPQQPWRLDQTWTYQYNLNLIGKDAMLVGEQRYELAPGQTPPEQIQLHSWQWSYNLSLVGKDRLPTGEQVYTLAPSQVLPEQIQLHSWSWQYNLNLRGKDTLATGQQVYDLPPIYPPYINQLRTWSYQYNLNLVGQDRMATGAQVWERPTLAVAPSAPTWAWQYNPNLVGQDQLPFRQRDWPLPIAPQQPALSWVDPAKIWLTAPVLNISIDQYWERPQLPVPPAQTWTWSYNLNLIGQDRLAIGKQTYDLAPIYPPYINQLRTWSWTYNLNLIGKDQLPAGVDLYELAPAQKPYEQAQLHSWSWQYNLNLIGKDQLPVLQHDWPNPTQPYRIDQTWAASYNLNLIGQDRMATGQQVTELPPRDFSRLFQTWIQSVNLALYVTPAVLDILKVQRDWPVPRGAEPDWRRGWASGYNLDLIGQDRLPFRQSDWPVPVAPQQVQGWIDQTKILLTAVQRPFVQSDWPLPQVPQGAIQTWINTVSLALTAKPFNQTDWPNPTQPARDPTLSTVAASYNRNLIGQDRLPNRQQDWPLPFGHALSQIPLQIMVQGKPFFLVPIVALPPGKQLYDRTVDPRLAAADIAWPAWRWPQITPPPVTGVIPLRTLMGTGV